MALWILACAACEAQENGLDGQENRLFWTYIDFSHNIHLQNLNHYDIKVNF